jgi:hypothetical protein
MKVAVPSGWQQSGTPMSGTPMRIELLYVHACPHAPTVLARLRELLREAGLEGAVTVACTGVDTVEQARAARFLGSPTVRVDGRDIDPATARRGDYGLGCRLYPGPSGSGVAGVPNDELLRGALQRTALQPATLQTAAAYRPAETSDPTTPTTDPAMHAPIDAEDHR